MNAKLTPIEADIHAFANARWPVRTLASRLRKLGEEVGELAEAVVQLHVGKSGTVDEIVAEAADCRIVLADLCALIGRSLDEETVKKLAVMKRRDPLPLRKDQLKGRK